MRNHLDKRLLWVSIGVHVFLVLVLLISYHTSRLHKSFVAYGYYSKRPTQAFFQRLNVKQSQSSCSRNKARLAKARLVAEKKKKAHLAKARLEKKRLAELKELEKARLEKTRLAKARLAKEQAEAESKKQEEEPEEDVEADEEADPGETSLGEEVLHFNLMGEVDPKMIAYQQSIQREVDRLWRPPIGVSKGTECIVTFVIDQDGAVKSFKIDKPSQMLIYDLSIVREAKRFKFDKCLWGKSFTINFRQ